MKPALLFAGVLLLGVAGTPELPEDGPCVPCLVARSVADDVGRMDRFDECTNDSDCFVKCERELGRPCTDEDVFGEPQPEDGECRPDDTLCP